MTAFDDNVSDPSGPGQNAPSTPPHSSPVDNPPAFLGGDPISHAAAAASSGFHHKPPAPLPEDLRISWSWPHLLLFLFFAAASQLAIGFVVLGYLVFDRHLTQAQLKHVAESDPRLIVGTGILWFALIILFLYVTLSVLRGLPFWRSLGWKKLDTPSNAGKGKPWMYFLLGCGLSLFVAFASSDVKDTDHLPIQELFKNPHGAILLMAMAVFIAPLVEETLFRGYLYPVLARTVTGVAEFFGVDPSAAIRTGIAISVILTGTFFGLMHGSQLGWTWRLVGLLIFVGVVFTLARAWTGTVLASFLLHLGYNSTIAVTTILATKGFTQIPPH